MSINKAATGHRSNEPPDVGKQYEETIESSYHQGQGNLTEDYHQRIQNAAQRRIAIAIEPVQMMK